MRVFVAGAIGAIGSRLVLLVEHGPTWREGFAAPYAPVASSMPGASSVTAAAGSSTEG
jgi:hypothetical protein